MYSGITDSAEGITSILSKSVREEKSRLDETLLRLTQIARMLPLTGDVLTMSLTYQTKFTLSPQDAIVLASITTDLESFEQGSKKLFVTQNKSDFLDPDIRDLMSGHGCKLLFRFDNAVGYVESILKRKKFKEKN